MNSITKLHVLLLLLLVRVVPGFAQQAGSISGKVVDGKTPIPYANIVLFADAAKQQQVQVAATDDDGKFVLDNIAPATYTLVISFIGYQAFEKAVAVADKPLALGELPLQVNSKVLGEVTITGQRSNVEFHIDKQVVNFTPEMLAGTTTASDVLTKVPQISMDATGRVKLRGDAGVRVLIDGKPTMLSTADVLATLPAGKLKKVEIITSPSAKYDPEGAAGILNIITQQQNKAATEGLVNVGVGLNKKYSGLAKLDYSYGKWSNYASLSFRHEDRPTQTSRQYYVENALKFTSLYKEAEIEKFTNAEIGTDYKIDSLSTASLSYQFSYLDRNTPSTYRQTGESVRNTGAGNVLFTTSENKVRAGYARNAEKNTVGVDFMYAWGIVDINSNNTLRSQSNTLLNSYALANQIDYFFFDYDVSYSRALSQYWKLDLGYSGEEVRFGNAFSSVIDNARNDLNYNYKESIQAVFSLFSYAKGNYKAQLGLRLENALQEISSIPKKPYVNLYPSLTVERKLDDSKSVVLNFSRRISRPDPFQFAPFVRYDNVNQRSQGNPLLKPAYANVVELNYLYANDRYNLKSSVFLRNSQDVINKIIVQEGDLTTVTFDNIDEVNMVGASVSGEANLLTWWGLNGGAEAFYNQISDDQYTYGRRKSVYSVLKLNSVWTVKKNLQLQVNSNYTTRTFEAQRKLLPFYTAGVTASMTTLKKRGNVSFRIDNLVYSGSRSWINAQPYLIWERYEAQNPVYRLSFSYKF
ncbi:TonB-dependent receptor family protein [Hymenobacter sp. HSC-4F20]|uniref:outer membrane beta-barrel family protein n=1 Tax=Hymenobacter sp. HSC-4F20 TaxID=2864135 RepID=UPI001C73A03C|nr:outer membrane beta-barrel family protein [Hymenobacter sp. HSC-4F20]MBX0292999.1 TonB-dependent receptor family protein [Hymenobacter sp. HSC-4F20]